MDDHLTNLSRRLPALEPCLGSVRQAYEMLRDGLRSGGRIFLCGNGGSAADCEHWAGEMLKGFYHKRPLSAAEKARLPDDLAANLQGGLPVIPLTGFVGLSTAVANDVAPHLIFAQLVWALARPGDILVGLSTSGNARNVIAAMETARAKSVKVIGLTGSTGGQLKPLTDLCICVPAVETYLIQEMHLPIYHALSLMLEQEFFG